jgi:hypothetical protein
LWHDAVFICRFLSDLFPLLFTLSFLGKTANGVGFHGAYLHSSEYYPTVIRNVGVGCGSLFARLGGLVAPHIARLVSKNYELSADSHPEIQCPEEFHEKFRK